MGVAAVSLGTGVSHLACLPLGLGVGLAMGESLISGQAALTVFLLGLLLNGVVAVCWRISYVLSRYVGIGVMIYLIPALSLVWLRLLGLFGDVSLLHSMLGISILVGSGALLPPLLRWGRWGAG